MKIGFAALALLSAGCSGGRDPSTEASVVTVFAAASVTEAVEAAARAFEKGEGIRVRTSFAGSSTLARQIEAGAEADLFLSANEEWADHVAKHSPVVARRDLLTNRLVAVALVGSSARIAKSEDLLAWSVQRIAMADPEAVPAGIYAREALERLGLWERLKAKIVPAADVRQALLYVERGEADVGFVYATDASLSRGVRVAFEFPPGLTRAIVYPLVLLDDKPSAWRFYDYLASPDGARIFRRFGFTRAEGP